MQHHELLRDLLVLFGFATLIAVALRRTRQSTVVAYLLTGIVVGPSGLHLITNHAAIEVMAEVGVALLLFSIGIEFSLNKIIAMRKLVVGVGGRQVMLTIALVLGLALAAGHPWRQGLYWGFLAAASSTAVVLKLLQERQELESVHGRAILGALLFQDLCVVPMMAVLPALAAPSGQIVLSIVYALGKVIGAGALILFAARYFFPRLWHRIAAVRNKEIFIIAGVFFSLGTAWASASLGLSLALGAFIAGLALSESLYAQQILSDILPFRDTFTSLFFISVGMLLNLSFLRVHWSTVAGVAGLIIAVKLLTASAAPLTMGFTPRNSLRVGLNLAQVGEFSFILLLQGTQVNLMPAGEYQVFLAAAIITMMLTPTMIQISPHLATRVPDVQRLRRLFPEPGELEMEARATPLRDHVIVCGYGLNGRFLAKALRRAGISYLVLEIDPSIVSRAAAQGESIFFGDSTQSNILLKAGATRARALVLALSDPFVLPRAISTARTLNPSLTTIVRTARVEDVEELEQAGAAAVVAAELSAAKEIVAQVLGLYERESAKESIQAEGDR